MPINRKFFFEQVRLHLFDGVLKPSQVAGLDAILDRWSTDCAGKDDRWLAYMLATAHHETGRTMQPVRETFAASDAQAIQRLDKAFAKGVLTWVRRPYWQRDEQGRSWLGRGFVQLTHEDNYRKMTRETGIDFLSDPSLAMELKPALAIMFVGMEKGSFSGKKLGDYFGGPKEKWREARQIINGLERADLVGSYGKKYYAAISYT